IVPMSLQLVIPRRVALQQSSPPLHQPSVILKEKRKFEKEELWNGECANSKLSQRRGSPQDCVPDVCTTKCTRTHRFAAPSFHFLLLYSSASWGKRLILWTNKHAPRCHAHSPGAGQR